MNSVRTWFVVAGVALAALGFFSPSSPAVLAADVTATWSTTTSGNWNVNTNWINVPALGGFPNNGAGGVATYDAVIGPLGAPYTVTLDTNITVEDLLLNSANATVSHTAGTLTATGAINLTAGTFSLAGGTIANSTVNATVPITLTSALGTLSAVTVNGDLVLNTSNARALITNGTTFTTAHLAGFVSEIGFAPGQTLSGAIQFEGATGNPRFVSLSTPGSFAVGAAGVIKTVAGLGGDPTIGGGGFTFNAAMALTNNGLISSQVSGRTLTVNPATSFFNSATGTLEAKSGGILTIGPTATWTNGGMITVNASTLNLGGTFNTTGGIGAWSNTGGTVNVTGTINNTGSTLTLNNATGSWNMVGGMISGGSLAFANSQTLNLTSTLGTLSGVTVNGDLSFPNNLSQALIAGGTTFTTAHLAGLLSEIGFVPGQTLSGTIQFEGAAGNPRYVSLSTPGNFTIGATGVIKTVAGLGGDPSVGVGQAFNGAMALTNNGLISSQVSGRTITLNPATSFTNAGTLEAISGGILAVPFGYTQTAGVTRVSSGGTISTFHQPTLSTITVTGGRLEGTGTIMANVANSATIAPGLTAGTLAITGNLTLAPTSTVQIEIGGTSPGTQYDQLHVTGQLALGGTLNVSVINSFNLAAGNLFDFLDWGSLNGKFSSVLLPPLSSPLAWYTSQLYNNGRVSVIDTNFLPGDFNRDGHVNVADLQAMVAALTDLNAYQSTNTLTSAQLLSIGDIDLSGTVTNADLQSLLNLLKGGGGSLAAVPEPASIILLALALPPVIMIGRLRRKFGAANRQELGVLKYARKSPSSRVKMAALPASRFQQGDAYHREVIMRGNQGCFAGGRTIRGLQRLGLRIIFGLVLASIVTWQQFTAPAARGASIFWDGTGTSWNSASFWSTASNSTTPDPAASPGAADIANFNITTVNAPQTVNLTAAQSALGLVFSSSGRVLIQTGSGTNALTIGASGITVNSGAGADTISSAVSLGGAQSWTNNSGSTLTVSGNISNGANLLTVAGTGNTTISGILGNGSGGLTKSGSGALSLNGANTYAGPTTISSGSLVLGDAGALGSTAGGTTVLSGATLDLGGQTIGAEALTIQGNGVGGNGALVNSSGTAASFAGTINGSVSSQSFAVGGTGDLNLSGSINGLTLLTKVGNNIVTLSGTTDNGGLSANVSAGTLVLAKISSHAPDVHAVGWDLPLLGMVVSGGTAQLGGTGGDQIFDSGAVTVTSGAFDTNGRSETIAALSLQGTGIGGAGALVNSASTASILTPSGTTLTGNTTIGVTQAAGSLTLNNPVSGNFALTKVGLGALVLTGANTFHGGLNIQNGAVQVNTINNISTNGPLGNNTIVGLGTAGLSGTGKPIGTLEYTGGTASSTMSFNIATSNGGIQIDLASTNLTLNGVISGSGELNKYGPGTLTLSGNNTFSNLVIINAGTIQVGSAGAINPNMDVAFGGSGTFSLAGNSVTVFALSAGGTPNNAIVTQNGSATPATLTISLPGPNSAPYEGVIQDGGAGSLSVVMTGGGTEFFAGSSNTFTGGLAVKQGTIGISTINNASTTGALGNNTNVSLGTSGQTGTIEYMGGTASSTMPFTLVSGGTGGFQVDTAAANLALSGAISGSGALNKSGAGTLTLSGTNTYSGTTTVSAGTLVLGNSNALGSTAGGTTVLSGATLDLGGQTIGAEALTIQGNGVGGNGALVNSSGTAASFAGTINGSVSSQSFAVGGTGDLNLSGSINGLTLLTKVGNNIVTLSGTTDNGGLSANVSAGTLVLAKISSHAPDVHAVGWDLPLLGMVVSGGTAQLGGTGGDQIFDSGAVTVTSGAFDTNGRSETIAALSLQGTGIGGAGALVNSASTASILTPSGTTLTGNTTIGVTQAAGSLTLNNPVSGNFALTKIGAGTLILSGNNTYAGTTTVSQGALIVNGHHTGSGAYSVTNGGTLGGNGNIGSNVSVEGSSFLSPGASIGTLTVNSAALGGTLHIDINEADPNVNDVLNVTGSLALSNARLVVVLTGTRGHAVYIFSHYGSFTGDPAFASINLGGLPTGYSLDYNYANSHELALVSYVRGDFNRDGHVNAADIPVMLAALTDLNAYKSAQVLSDADLLAIGDVDGDSKVTNADLQALLTVLKSGGGSADAVPEPASIVLMTLVMPGLAFAAARRHHSELAFGLKPCK